MKSSFGHFGPAEILIVGTTVLSLAGWIVLYQWYSLSDHISIPDFAFDKIPGHFDSPVLRYTTLIFLAISLLYQASYWMLRRAVTISGTMKVAIVGLVVGTAVVNVFLYPVGARDVLHYATQLKLEYHYGLNPYVSSFRFLGADPFAKYSFYPEFPHLPYGPVWLALSGVATWPFGFTNMLSVIIALKVFNVVLLAATGWAVYAYQEDEKRGWLSAYVFLANPWVLFEGVGNGHNDVMAALLLVLGVLALKRRSSLSVAFLTASALVKFFTFVLFPLFLLEMVLRRWSNRRITVSVLLGILTLVAFVVPFWAGGGMLRGISFAIAVHGTMYSWSVFSLVQQYLGENGFSTAWFPFVYRFFLGMFAVLAVVLLWARWSGVTFQRALVTTYLIFSALVTYLFSWYLVPVAALLALDQDLVSVTLLFTVSTAYLVLYPVSVWAWFNSGLSFFGIHLFQAVFLLLPILAFLILDLTRSGLEIAGRGPGRGAQ